MNRKTRLIASISIIVLVLVAGMGYISYERIALTSKSYIDEIKSKGELTVITRNAPTTYYQGRDGLSGFEYDLIHQFAQHLNVTVKIIVKENTSDILAALQNGEGVIAAAGLTKTNKRKQDFLFGPSYQMVEQQLVCRRGDEIPKSVQDLVNVDIWVTANTSYVDTLNDLKSQLPELRWQESMEFDTEQLLERVWLKEIGCTIADSNIVAINRRYYPELVVAFDLTEAEKLVWLLPSDAVNLQAELHNWLMGLRRDGELNSIIDRYYGYAELFDYVDLKRFSHRVKKRLPQFESFFKAAAEKHELSWTLLAAQSYQESHWRPKAKSPTGVRGMMMLTLNTARDLGIKSRLNAEMSIHGGAKYLSQLRDRLPETINEPDRTWFALAAYNVGMGHLYDARQLAEELGKNKDKWRDVSEVLPLLSQKKYYKNLKYGYARGSEPVLYVQRIRDFRNILEREITIAEAKEKETTENSFVLN